MIPGYHGRICAQVYLNSQHLQNMIRSLCSGNCCSGQASTYLVLVVIGFQTAGLAHDALGQQQACAIASCVAAAVGVLPLKVMPAACRALSKVLDEASATTTFQNLAKKLIALVQKPSAITSPALPAALKALGSLGQVAPAAFAEHASDMADFVLDELFEAPVSSLSPGKAKHLKSPVEGKTGTSPHQGIVLKMLGLKVTNTKHKHNPGIVV